MHNPTLAADVNYTEQGPRFDEFPSGIEARQARQVRSARLVGCRVAGFRLAAG
jgi:hypothetical protein